MTTQTLATGAALTPESFNDFIQRLRHHCVGEGVNNHHTANALFIVQARRELAPAKLAPTAADLAKIEAAARKRQIKQAKRLAQKGTP